MNFTSLAFWGFTLITIALYYLLSGKSQNLLLLFASYVFYCTWDWHFAVILGAITIFNFYLTKLFQGSFALKVFPANNHSTVFRKSILWFGILINISMLILFKQSDFFIPKFQSLLLHLSLIDHISLLRILLPVGMSFYILQAISYLVDSYQNRISDNGNFVNVALYLVYFPKLLSGPIERAGSFLPKLSESKVVDNQQIIQSVSLILIGLIRKIVVADIISARIPLNFYKSPADYSAIDLIFWWVAFMVSLYNDFAGYTSIAIGISGLFGIDLSPNFENPFFSTSITEFWNRWHMSLSHWLRDYVFFPLSRFLRRHNQDKTFFPNIVIPPFVTMVLCGLWHGESWNYVLWGLLMGIWIAGEHAYSVFSSRNLDQIQLKPWHPRKILQWFGFLVILFLLFVPFMFNNIGTSITFLQSLATRWLPPLTMLGWRLPILAFGVAFIIDWCQYIKQDELPFIRFNPKIQSILLALSIILVFLGSHANPANQFIYQGF